MRTVAAVAAVVGGAGAALGALYYFLAIVGWVAIGLLSGPFWPTTLVDLAFVGPFAAAVLLSGVGLVGAWRTWRGAARRVPCSWSSPRSA